MAEPIPSWSEIQEDLEFFDRALLDIVATRASSETWKMAIEFLLKESDFSAFFIDGDPVCGRFRGSFEEAEGMKNECSVHASFYFGRLLLNCFFFSINEIDLDANPRKITNETSYLLLVGICGALANHLSREVRLCGEGFPDNPIVVFEPIAHA